MPTYDYTCNYCSKDFEIFHSMNSKPETNCPECNKDGLIKKVSAGSGLIFKGTGFYITDYKKDNGGSSASKTCSTQGGCSN